MTAEPAITNEADSVDAVSYGRLPKLLGYNLRRAQTALFKHFIREVTAKTGVTPGMFGMLHVIAANPGLSQSRLAEAMGVDRSTIVKVVDQLEQRGMIARLNAPRDRRKYCLELTENGIHSLAEIERLAFAHEDEFFEGFSAEERNVLMHLLIRLCELPCLSQQGAPAKSDEILP